MAKIGFEEKEFLIQLLSAKVPLSESLLRTQSHKTLSLILDAKKVAQEADNAMAEIRMLHRKDDVKLKRKRQKATKKHAKRRKRQLNRKKFD